MSDWNGPRVDTPMHLRPSIASPDAQRLIGEEAQRVRESAAASESLASALQIPVTAGRYLAALEARVKELERLANALTAAQGGVR